MKPHGEKKKACNVIGNKADLKSQCLVPQRFHFGRARVSPFLSLQLLLLFHELSLKLTRFFFFWGGAHICAGLCPSPLDLLVEHQIALSSSILIHRGNQPAREQEMEDRTLHHDACILQLRKIIFYLVY